MLLKLQSIYLCFEGPLIEHMSITNATYMLITFLNSTLAQKYLTYLRHDLIKQITEWSTEPMHMIVFWRKFVTWLFD